MHKKFLSYIVLFILVFVFMFNLPLPLVPNKAEAVESYTFNTLGSFIQNANKYYAFKLPDGSAVIINRAYRDGQQLEIARWIPSEARLIKSSLGYNRGIWDNGAALNGDGSLILVTQDLSSSYRSDDVYAWRWTPADGVTYQRLLGRGLYLSFGYFMSTMADNSILYIYDSNLYRMKPSGEVNVVPNSPSDIDSLFKMSDGTIILAADEYSTSSGKLYKWTESGGFQEIRLDNKFYPICQLNNDLLLGIWKDSSFTTQGLAYWSPVKGLQKMGVPPFGIGTSDNKFGLDVRGYGKTQALVLDDSSIFLTYGNEAYLWTPTNGYQWLFSNPCFSNTPNYLYFKSIAKLGDDIIIGDGDGNLLAWSISEHTVRQLGRPLPKSSTLLENEISTIFPLDNYHGLGVSRGGTIFAINGIGAQIIQLQVEPVSINLLTGQKQQLTIIASYSDGSTKDLTSLASYQSSDVSIANVSGTGLVTAVAPGSANITITYKDKSKTIPITVLSLDNITVKPASVNVEEGKPQQLTVTAHYSNGSSADVTTLASYQTDNSQVATVSNDGLVTGVKAGKATVTVTYEGKMATVPVTVAPILSGITVSPNPISMAKGQSQGITVTATYSDGSTKDVTGEVNFQVENVTIASVTNGVVKGLTQGNTQITVTYKSKTVIVPVTVTEAVVTKIEANPNPVSMPKGQSQLMTVTATYSDGNTKDVTGDASYQVGDSSIASVNGGKVTGLKKGNTQITITYQGQILQVPVVVTEAVVTKIEATPNPVSIAKGNSQQLTVKATYSDGSTRDVTQEASYQAENTSIVAVEDFGLVKGLTQGNTNVTVSYQGQSVQVPVNVAAPSLVELTVEPSQVSLEKGQSQKLTVIAKYSDGSTQDVSNGATFQVTDGTIASVANSVVKGEAQGNTHMTVSYQGQSVQVPVTVTAPKLTGLTVEPSSVSVEAGKSQNLKVTAYYSDGSSQDVTSQAGYQSKDGQIAVVNNGIITGIKQGSTQVTVSYQGQTVQVPVTVTAPPVTQLGISVVPNPIHISRYGSMRLQVIAVMSDGSTKDVTIRAQFTSQNTSIATVKSNGVVYGKSNGETKITVTYDGKDYEVPVIVGQIPVISQDRQQSQLPVVIYPDKQQAGTPVVIYPQK